MYRCTKTHSNGQYSILWLQTLKQTQPVNNLILVKTVKQLVSGGFSEFMGNFVWFQVGPRFSKQYEILSLNIVLVYMVCESIC